MKYILGIIFIIMGVLSLFTDENFWYTLVDFSLGYLLLKEERSDGNS